MKKRTKGVLAAALAAAGVFLLAGLDARLLVRAYTVESGRLTGPVRLAVLTDLHACAYGEAVGLLDAVAQKPPTWYCCAATSWDEPRMPEERALDTVEALAAVWPTYYVTGNHEFWTGRVDEVKARLEERGAVVLAGDCVTVTAAGQTVQLCGIDDPSVGETRWREQLEAVTAALDGEHCSILMTHRPERTEDYAGRGFELVLAGHAHGGQWRLPGLLNGLFAPDQGLFPTYAGGRYALGDTTLLVSRGLARESTRLPRFYNRPELVMVELRPGLEEFPAKKE
ncbi:MAG: metallophosphoesterase [Flavonifractor plautii]